MKQNARAAIELAEKTTGPMPQGWRAHGLVVYENCHSSDCDPICSKFYSHRDAEFVAASRALVPQLAADLLRALSALEKCRELREHFARAYGWHKLLEKYDKEIEAILKAGK